MLRNGARLGDVCGDEVPCRTRYRRGMLTPHAAADLLDTDAPKLVPTWAQLPDGTVEVEICLECSAVMDDPVSWRKGAR